MGKVQIKVKEYRDAKEFNRDAQKMTKDGWEIRQQSQGSTHANWGRTLFTTALTGGLNMLVPKGGASFTKGKITVTWVKPDRSEKGHRRGNDRDGVDDWDDASDGMKECPDCAELVRERAQVCRYCGHKFEEEESGIKGFRLDKQDW